ncbi:MAG: hypothetical protein R3C41_11615 [Calditrichia bacterium]
MNNTRAGRPHICKRIARIASLLLELGKFEESASAFEGALEHISRGALKGDTYYRLGNAYRELDQLIRLNLHIWKV